MWGGKFGGNFVPETLKKPINDLENLFSKLRITKILLLKETNILRIGLVHHKIYKIGKFIKLFRWS